MPQTLQKRVAELEVRVRERAESVKSALKEYRDILRKSPQPAKRGSRVHSTLAKKQLDLERANAEYIELRKELDAVLSRLHRPKRNSRRALVDLER